MFCDHFNYYVVGSGDIFSHSYRSDIGISFQLCPFRLNAVLWIDQL